MCRVVSPLAGEDAVPRSLRLYLKRPLSGAVYGALRIQRLEGSYPLQDYGIVYAPSRFRSFKSACGKAS